MVNYERLINTYLDLIRINSISGNEGDLANFIANKLSNIGLDVEWHNKENIGPSLYAELKGHNEGPTILMIGHMDTVDIMKGWTTDPFTPVIDGDKVYGLGACDMKGGIAAIIESLETMVENNVELKGNIAVAFVSDEEILSRGTYKLLQDGLKADMAIMAECRFSEAAIGFRGRYSINVTVYGETGHASKYPYVGESAIINASKLAVEIEKLPTKIHPIMGEGTWCIRHIEGGIKETLNVPDRCQLFVDRYTTPEETFDTCKYQILEAARRLGIEEKVNIELVPREIPYMEAFEIPKDHPLVTTIAEKFKEITGKELFLGYDKSVCDSNFLVNIGNIPTITFGPSGENMHQANEHGYMSQLKECAAIYLETIKSLLK
jgi:succinyl-diaminopimelate desuccinylase